MSEVVELKPEIKRTFEDCQKEAANLYAENGFLHFRQAVDQSKIQENNMKISKINKEALKLKGEENVASESK